MPPIPVVAPTIVRFSHHITVPGGRPAAMVMDVSLDEFVGSRTAAVNALVPLVCGQFQDTIAAALNPNLSYTGTQWLDIDALDGHGGFQGPIAGKPIHGSTVNALAPPEVCFLMHKNCVHNRQERNGRSYFPGVGESSVGEDGVVLPATATTMNTIFNGFRSAIGSGTLFPPASTALRVVHVAGHTGVPLPGFPNGKPNSWSSSDVDSFQCDAKVGIQRRRLRG